jgi:membrane protein involved in colicin uptake
MSETITEPTTTAPVVEPTAKADEPLGENGLAALKAEREARAAAEKRLKEFEDRDKTEAEKTAERLAAAEKRASELEAKALRAEVAAAKGVPLSLLSGSTKAELEAHADALITFRGEKQATGLVVPKEGSTSTPKPSNEREFVKQLFGSKGD